MHIIQMLDDRRVQVEGLIGALIALVGVTIGAALSHASTSRLAKKQRQWEEVVHKRNKLEELSLVLDLYENSYRKLSGSAALRVNNGTPMEFSGERIPETRLNTLLCFYAPEMLDEKAALDKLTAAYGAVIADVIGCSNLDKSEKGKLMVRVLVGHQKIEEQCKKLALMAAEIVRREVGRESSNKALNPQAAPAGTPQSGAR